MWFVPRLSSSLKIKQGRDFLLHETCIVHFTANQNNYSCYNMLVCGAGAWVNYDLYKGKEGRWRDRSWNNQIIVCTWPVVWPQPPPLIITKLTPLFSHRPSHHSTLSHCCGNSGLAYSASHYLGGNSDRASAHASRENVQINSWSRDEFSSRQRGLRMPHRIMGSSLGQTKFSERVWWNYPLS